MSTASEQALSPLPSQGREPDRSAFAHFVARLRALTFLGATFGSVLAIGFWLVPLAIIFDKPDWLKVPCALWARIILPLMGVRVKVIGNENLVDPAPRLFVPNHQSFLDIPLMMGWVRFPAFLAKKEIASWPWFGWSMKVLRCVFVDRKDRHSRGGAGGSIKAVLAQGFDFCIFPEGTRSFDGVILPMRPGAFQIAIDAGALITPVLIDPTWRILNKKGYRMWAGEVVISILPPIPTAGLHAPDRKALADSIEADMRVELDRLRNRK